MDRWGVLAYSSHLLVKATLKLGSLDYRPLLFSVLSFLWTWKKLFQNEFFFFVVFFSFVSFCFFLFVCVRNSWAVLTFVRMSNVFNKFSTIYSKFVQFFNLHFLLLIFTAWSKKLLTLKNKYCLTPYCRCFGFIWKWVLLHFFFVSLWPPSHQWLAAVFNYTDFDNF